VSQPNHTVNRRKRGNDAGFASFSRFRVGAWFAHRGRMSWQARVLKSRGGLLPIGALDLVVTGAFARILPRLSARPRRLLLLALALAWYATNALAEPSPVTRRGRFDVVTYNVAGLPEGLSRVHPVDTLPLVGARLGKYDLALVQEDYAYPELLRSRLRSSYQSSAFVRGDALHFGDGLSVFSKVPISELRRSAWRACHGLVDASFDCWTPKGLAMTRVEVSPGVLLDVYDVHLDAGAQPDDVKARAAQLQQLFETLTAWSEQRALLVGGDFNLTRAELPLLRRLMSDAGLRDACQALRCADPWRLDRILYRGSAALALRVRSYRIDASFRDDAGRQLSDHLPVAVTVDWTAPAR
jgi:endonuclease/exonuclease/phosphatase family metal-dependent hydrolase